ncbi:MAG: PEP-CTERM sorting domain-containing protein [Verrucomicrobia bacterium]|nr:PEP-CTERM sorting domain-containing protein [Verrucomicrobiota bacterium]
MKTMRRMAGFLALAAVVWIPATPASLLASGNPFTGYAGFENFYTLPYQNNPGFGANSAPSDPKIRLSFSGNTLDVNLDTGSRALYVAVEALAGGSISPSSALFTGQVYLNSSARVYLGTWHQQTVSFPQAVASNPSLAPASASLPMLVVDTLACSTTPPPGTASATTTFSTLIESGVAMLTNGTNRSFTNSTLQLFGGEAVSYLQNPGILAPVMNFGVGFDRTGRGTSPNNNSYNQQYNAFLNLGAMANGSMLPGFIIQKEQVQLGLTSNTTGFAYTNLLPTGYTQPNPGVVPDWQAPTGTLVYGGVESGSGQVVVDIGINSGILTLPGQPETGTADFTTENSLVVHLLNSGGEVSYVVNGEDGNFLDPTSTSWFAPLPGDFSENQPPLQGQFFNTGRNVINAFEFLYDGLNGYAGVKPNGLDIPAADIRFTAGFYPNPIPEPRALALFAVAVGAFFWFRRRRLG